MSAEPVVVPGRPEHPVGARLAELEARLGITALAPAAAAAPGSAPLRLRGATLDSRAVRPGDLYCALPGASTHGARFAAQAAQAGALAALTDPDGAELCREAGLAVLCVENPRAATARAAALIQGDPSARLQTVGVTGTNGKTSVTTMLHRALLELGRGSGLIGTAGTLYRTADGAERAIRTARTTPESPDVQGILARMLEDGVGSVAMEVSSHAMILHRADGIVFDAVCFTNLSQDHLDFHPTMEDYFAAKASLFAPEHARAGVVCTDDAWGRRLAAQSRIPVLTYSTDPASDADAVVTDVQEDGFGSRFTARLAGGEEIALRSALPGLPYVANTLAVLLLLRTLGITGGDVAGAVSRSGVVPGRMELVAEDPVLGIVDFSHTEDALAKTLATLRAVPRTRRLLVVMGAGGDRDRGKRPRMGAVAAETADVVIVTDDNPRSEDPAAIRAAVLSGIPAGGSAEVHEVPGRADAIALACSLAQDGDTVLVAGKGAETGQEIAGAVLPFDDREELRRHLAERAADASRTPGAPRAPHAPTAPRPGDAPRPAAPPAPAEGP